MNKRFLKWDDRKWQSSTSGAIICNSKGWKCCDNIVGSLAIPPSGEMSKMIAVKTDLIPVTCSWAQTPAACAEDRCRSLWKASGTGSPPPAARSGWWAERCLAVPRCRVQDGLPCPGPGCRRLAAGWGGACRSKPVSVTSKPTAQTPPSTEGRRRDLQH